MHSSWTEEETERLVRLAPTLPSWVAVASYFPGRNNEACRNKAKRLKITHTLGAEWPPITTSQEETPPALARLLEAPHLSAEEMFDAIMVLQGLIEEADPILTHTTVEIDTSRPIVVVFSSCDHIGSRYVEYPVYQDMFHRTVNTPNVYWCSHGDYTDNFMTSFRNAQPVLSQLIHPKLQRGMAGYVIETLAKNGRLLYGCAGNHEDMAVRVIGEDLMARHFLERDPPIPYFPGKGVVDLYVGEERYVIGCAHQWPGTSYFNPTHAQIRALLNDLPTADIIAGGHKHQFGYMELSHHLMEHDAGHFPSTIAHLIAIGTAASKPDPYAIKGWTRGEFVYPMLCLYPDRHMIKRVYDWEDIEYFTKHLP